MATKDTAKRNNDAFLALWADLEQVVRRRPQETVPDLEAALQGSGYNLEADKLRICRQTRNFLVHGNKAFITASDPMLDFLAALIDQLKRVDGIVKDHMVTPAKFGAVIDNVPVEKAAAMLQAKKSDELLILDQNKMFTDCVFGKQAMAAAITKGLTGASVHALLPHLSKVNFHFVGQDAALCDAPACRCIVVDKNGRCVGVLNPDKEWF